PLGVSPLRCRLKQRSLPRRYIPGHLEPLKTELAIPHRAAWLDSTSERTTLWKIMLGEIMRTANWPAEKANEWYRRQPWLVGCNFIPSTAINQIEMWQSDTFDPTTIDRELGWAAAIGFNSMRVFLHDLVWQTDAEGCNQRISQYLEIAERHGIQT